MTEPLYRANVLVCTGTSCTASGSVSVLDALRAELARRGLEGEVRAVETGCRGFCAMGPVMIIYPEGIFYCQVQATDIEEIVEETLVKGRVVERLTYKEPLTHQAIPFYKDIPFYGKQLRITLRNCGFIDPESIEEYVAREGYEALGKALTTMTPEQVIDVARGDIKYIVCNADEGDPGAFMDRSILEGDPHSVLEGMTVAAYAIGAHEGYIYCRAEYPLAIKRLKIAIQQAEDWGLLGEGILGTDFDFRIRIKEGAGAASVASHVLVLLSQQYLAFGASRPTITTSRAMPMCPRSS